MIRFQAIFTVLLGLITTSTQAQEAKPYLVIKVLDELGKPLANAQVKVSKNEETVADELTDFNGTITIVVHDIGTHRVKIHDGFNTQTTEVQMKKGPNELFFEMGRESLKPITIEMEPVLIDDSYGGAIALEGDAVSSPKGCPGSRGSLWNLSAQVIGGVWLSDTRAPTFQNMMNLQPND